MVITQKNKNLIRSICETHSVETLYLFGSATGNTFGKSSDIDFLVKFRAIDLSTYFENYMGLKQKLKKIFKRDVDLVEEQTLKNPILINSINKSKELIYG
ncbi:MAG: nucleotidyltransferase domain-containing protein [Aquaticitalea sp.]